MWLTLKHVGKRIRKENVQILTFIPDFDSVSAALHMDFVDFMGGSIEVLGTMAGIS